MKKLLAVAVLALPLAGCYSTMDAASTGSAMRYSSSMDVAATGSVARVADVEVTGSVAAPQPRGPRCEYDAYYERRVCYR
jgi:hypothetical protein